MKRETFDKENKKEIFDTMVQLLGQTRATCDFVMEHGALLRSAKAPFKVVRFIPYPPGGEKPVIDENEYLVSYDFVMIQAYEGQSLDFAHFVPVEGDSGWSMVRDIVAAVSAVI